MEQLKYAIRNGETVIGSACAERQGLYWRVTAEAAAEPDCIVRLYAHDGENSMNLGVLIPEAGRLRLSRRIPASAFSFTPDTRITTGPDAPKTADGEGWEPFSGDVLGYPAAGMQKKSGGGTQLAITYEPGREFPLMPLFRFCALRQVQGRLCWVLLLDADGKPAAPGEKKPLTSAENVVE